SHGWPTSYSPKWHNILCSSLSSGCNSPPHSCPDFGERGNQVMQWEDLCSCCAQRHLTPTHSSLVQPKWKVELHCHYSTPERVQIPGIPQRSCRDAGRRSHWRETKF